MSSTTRWAVAAALPLAAVWTDEDAGNRLADEIRLSIDYYMAQPQARSVGEVVLSGPGSSEDEIIRHIGAFAAGCDPRARAEPAPVPSADAK